MRILLIRTSALGDVVHALPVLTALRRHLPAASIAWLVEGAFAPVLEGHPDLDTTIPVQLRKWRRQPFSAATMREWRQFHRALADFSADIVLDLMGNHKAGVLGALTLADRRIGFAHGSRREATSAIWSSETVTPRHRHAAARGLELLSALGLPEEPADFGAKKIFRVIPETTQQWLATHPEPFVLLHPGAGWGNKRYLPERWGQVAAKLTGGTSLRVFVASGPGEEALADTVVSSSAGAAEIVRAPSLPELGSLLRHARLVLGGDTGPLHLAHALGTPTLFLMGPTDPERHGPYGSPERAMARRLPCSYCYQRLATTKACLLDIRPEEIAATALDLLASARPGGN